MKKAYRIEWLYGYEPQAPEVHSLDFFQPGNGFEREDIAQIAALANGECVRMGGPCDAVRITCFPFAYSDWDASTLQGEALARYLPQLRVALFARNRDAQAREWARECLHEVRALYAAIAHAEQIEAKEDEQERQEAYYKQSGR